MHIKPFLHPHVLRFMISLALEDHSCNQRLAKFIVIPKSSAKRKQILLWACSANHEYAGRVNHAEIRKRVRFGGLLLGIDTSSWLEPRKVTLS